MSAEAMVACGTDWGVRPVLFRLGTLAVPSYGFFVALGLLTGLAVFAWEVRGRRSVSENTFWILVAAVVGGVLGAKLPLLVTHFRDFLAWPPNLAVLISGRSIVGGLAGGAVGVWLLKRNLGIRERKGNLFAPAIAAGVAVGRLGCFLRGCCLGTPTALPWAVDFGDGVGRHPTQLYESVFMLALFTLLAALRPRVTHPAVLLWVLMTAYFLFRFAVEFIRVEPVWFAGLTFFQWLSLGLVIAYGSRLARLVRAKEARA
jgi:phosphatidylglycerol:prolipoprotein diacylglycerol transferase